MGAIDFQTFLGHLERNCFIYTVMAVTGLLERTVPGCQEDCSPIPGSGHCLPSHPHCYVNKGQSTENLLRPLIWLTGVSEPANLQLLMLSAFPISPCSWKLSICLQLFKWLFQPFCICFPICGNCFTHHIPLLFLLSHMPHEPAIPSAFLPFFSFILIRFNTPEHLCSFSYLQTSFILPFSMILCPDKVSLYPFSHVSVAIWVQCLLLSKFCFRSWVDASSPLLASELTINSARGKKKVHTHKHKKIKTLLVQTTEGKALSSTGIQATQSSTFFKVNFLCTFTTKPFWKKLQLI